MERPVLFYLLSVAYCPSLPSLRFGSSRHGVIFETVVSLLSLVRTGDRDAYRQFFMDSMLVVEDLLHVASLSKASVTESSKVSLRCFCESLTAVSSGAALLSDLPSCSKPADGYGILINLTGENRWQPFATWVIKLLCKCITEGTLYVEGLIHVSFVSAACNLLCYGDANLHMACFDFARIIGAVMNYEIVPSEKLILSIATILSEDKKGLPVFRDTSYDSSMGGCLHALHSSCSGDIVKLTAADLVNIFPESMRKTRSPELKTALCSAYIRIAKSCGPHIWKPESLIYMLYSSKPCFPLIDCFQVAVSILGPDLIGEGRKNDASLGLSTSENSEFAHLRVGEKRPLQDPDAFNRKRQKVDEEFIDHNTKYQDVNKLNYRTCEGKKEYADYMRTSLLLFLELLEPPGGKANSLGSDLALTSLSTLCIVFSEYPHANHSLGIFRQLCEWIPWIYEQAKQGISITFDLSFFLEAFHSVLLMESFLPLEDKLFGSKSDVAELMQLVLKLPWTHTLVVTEHHQLRKAKCLSIQILSKMGPMLQSGSRLEVLDLCLHDEAEEVRTEAVIAMPLIVFWSGSGTLTHMFKRLE